MNWAPDGATVSFQHGPQGVFVADPLTGQPRKILEIDERTIAVSAPRWSPTGRQLVFTTARRAPSAASPPDRPAAKHPLVDWPVQPDGARFRPEAVVYTCWLYTVVPEDGPPQVERLFAAACDHPGYIGADLAVRWQSDGQGLLYLDRDPPSERLGLFAWHLEKKTRSRIQSIPTADALLFDCSPHGSQASVICARKEQSPGNGLWVGDPARGGPWWRVPGTDVPARGTSDDLQRLRNLRPAWSGDGQHLLLIAEPLPSTASAERRWILSHADIRRQSVREVLVSDRPLGTPRWHPDGRGYGIVRDVENPELQLYRTTDAPSPAARVPGVLQFIGWSAAGTELACVTSDPPDLLQRRHWSLLLLPDRDAQHRLVVSGAWGESPRSIVDRIHLSFPQWSPDGSRLSLWGTFAPTYRSLVSVFSDAGASLRKGDPAVILDAASGRTEWLAVDPSEQLQMAHYQLRKHEFQQAWDWYEAARRERATRPSDRGGGDENRAGLPSDHPELFESICLAKLGRVEEATARREVFRQSSATWRALLEQLSREAADEPGNRETAASALELWLAPASPALPFLQDLYAAEVFLSLDLLDDGIAYLKQEADGATTDAQLLAHVSVLSQLLLIRGDKTEYARLVTDVFLPTVLRLKPPFPEGFPDAMQWGSAAEKQFAEITYATFGAAVFLPLIHAEFIADLPQKVVEELGDAWGRLYPQAKDDVERLALDLLQYSAARRLGRAAERNTLAARIQTNPAGANWLAGQSIDERLAEFAEGLRQFQAALGGGVTPANRE